ncbi:M14 family zinc carboxypeptidase [Salipaludibacillus sp. HK11]|uniref:M14 family zinc carboxypeptidase n=1 Tax=Salipaludibacillus sp. HK11 TaxID=3394320 RepID=UPI0039FBAEAD
MRIKNIQDFFKRKIINKKDSQNSSLEIRKIPYKFEGEVAYQPYSAVESRINAFNDVSVIGKDASGDFNMYLIELGDKSKPTIMVLASLHGSEWQSTQYTLTFMEQLRDNILEDQAFRDVLLDEFHIAYIPVGNPWGYERTRPHARLRGRKNANRVNLNRDFKAFSQQESQNIKKIMDDLKPFSYIDCHLMAPKKDGGQNYQDLIVGNVDGASNIYRDFIADSLSLFAGRPVERWDERTNEMHQGLSRRYLVGKNNPYTADTFTYILEIYRPVDDGEGVIRYLSDHEIKKFGMAGLYFFLQASMKHYQSRGK